MGNVEGRDLAGDRVDVIVTDGFTGNVMLKTAEGAARLTMRAMLEAVSGPEYQEALATLAPPLMSLRARLDPEGTGGASLLGVRGNVVIAHGSSSGSPSRTPSPWRRRAPTTTCPLRSRRGWRRRRRWCEVADPASIAAVEEHLGHRFADRRLLVEALTHRSYSGEHGDTGDYERLEFLGDAVLQLAVTRHLYETYPDLPEGQLAKVRAGVVSERTLHEIAPAARRGVGAAPRPRRGGHRGPGKAVAAQRRGRGADRGGVPGGRLRAGGQGRRRPVRGCDRRPGVGARRSATTRPGSRRCWLAPAHGRCT